MEGMAILSILCVTMRNCNRSYGIVILGEKNECLTMSQKKQERDAVTLLLS